MARGRATDRLPQSWPGRRTAVRIAERMVAIFFLTVLCFSPLIISIFDRGPGTRVFGLPLLYAYLFSAWLTIIVLLAVVIERVPGERRARPPRRNPGPGEV